MVAGDQELKSFMEVWFVAILCVCYCYLIPNRIMSGIPRLLSFLPVITFFFILPLSLSTIHLTLLTLFQLTWLGNFKLLLFAFNRDPLVSTPPLPLFAFISIALFPIHRKQSLNVTSVPLPASTSTPALNTPVTHTALAPALTDVAPSHKPIILAFKAMILGLIIGAYQYKDNLHPNVILFLFCCHLFVVIELLFALIALFVKFFLGFEFEIEPQFNEPLLATSLQDFWGRRWNLMATSILRATIFDPICDISKPILGRLLSQLPAVLATFLVSGLIHELMYLYLTCVPPTWEVTWLFILHGVCTVVEVAVKKAVKRRFRLHRAVSGPLTVMFVVVTGIWLLLPPLSKNGLDVTNKRIINFRKSYEV